LRYSSKVESHAANIIRVLIYVRRICDICCGNSGTDIASLLLIISVHRDYIADRKRRNRASADDYFSCAGTGQNGDCSQRRSARGLSWSVSVRGKHVHVLRATGQRHLQLSPLAKIEFNASIQHAAKLRRRCATNAGPQRLTGCKADALKIVDPSEIDPGGRWRVEHKGTTFSRIEESWNVGGAIHRREICAHTLAHWHHPAANCKAGHKMFLVLAFSNQQLALSTWHRS